MKATADLKNDHMTVRRLGAIVQNCSEKLYLNQDIPIEDIELISVIIVEFDPLVLTTKEIKNRLDKSGYKFVRLANRGF